MDILIVLEGANGAIHRISKEALTAAQALGKDINQKIRDVLVKRSEIKAPLRDAVRFIHGQH